MGMPKKIKAWQLFIAGVPYPGTVSKVQLPKLGRKFEEYRADVMAGPVEIDLGSDKLQASFTLEEYLPAVLDDWGVCNHKAVKLELKASAESDDCQVDPVRAVMWGRWRELDPGEWESGKSSQSRVEISLSHYEYHHNGEKVFIDMEMGVERSGGVDRTAARRAAIGMGY